MKEDYRESPNIRAGQQIETLVEGEWVPGVFMGPAYLVKIEGNSKSQLVSTVRVPEPVGVATYKKVKMHQDVKFRYPGRTTLHDGFYLGYLQTGYHEVGFPVWLPTPDSNHNLNVVHVPDEDLVV